jgi:hypothetical protein
MLRGVDVCDVADVSEVYAAFIFIVQFRELLSFCVYSFEEEG